MNTPVPNVDSLPDPDLSGKQLGNYLLLRRLGRGGMAEVYLAEQESLRRQVAFKVLKRELAGDDSYVRRFHNEAQAAAALVHANIVQIFEVGNLEGTHYIAQEYVKGQNLKQFLMRHGAVDLFLGVSIMRQVAAALIKAAEHGVIHRDIKPENIMLSGGGEVKVADFGLARITSDQHRTDLTQVGITMGTPLYMSPEQVEGKTVDPRSDIYSFGVTCYQMLAGRPPFEGETALAVAVQHLKKDAVPLEEIRPDLPSELCAIIHRTMAKSPNDRFQSAASLLRELRRLKVDESDETWAETLEQLSVTEAQTLAGSHLAATQQLADIMQAANREQGKRSTAGNIGLFVILLLAGVFSGVAVAYWNYPQDLLAVHALEKVRVPRQETAQAQYRFAHRLNTESAWKAVREYFPPTGTDRETNRLYALLASARLGELYLREQDWDAAEAIYSSLEEVEDSEKGFRITGLAGLAIVYFQQGRDNPEQQEAKFDLAKSKINEIAKFSETTSVDGVISEYLSNTTLGNEFPFVRNALRLEGSQ